ncbi:Apolipoprotein N-acyltransferase [Aquisphaera giovannonii]|uniref:Apolipoprotein N-acyltransferase n=1 Tax=Aquisphaera giovannonii TaxID=406548 RepID=A0A5B9WE04_9BACT|nr:apolipoprotein N-acyltransferase [Aquisphaera giovannonii]QEH38201.1 Apolipoprotein N-acyltransferase [Aquisphaera giovannonii]
MTSQQDTPRDRPGGRLASHPLAAGLLSGLILWTAFPPLEWSWLAWVALVPLFWLAVQPRGRKLFYLSAWLGGLAFWLPAVQWLRLTDDTAWLAWLAMATFLSLWWPTFLGLCRVAVFRLRVPLMMAAPIIWVGLEYFRAHVLTGFPWYYLGHSQYRFLPLIQIADTTSALGVSFLVALVNACVVDLITLPLLYATPRGPRLRPRQAVGIAIAGGLVLAAVGYGSVRIASSSFRDGPRVALLQTNFEQRYKMGAEPELIRESIGRLVEKAAAGTPRPDLIVWPETAYPYRFIMVDPAVPADEMKRQVAAVAGARSVESWLDFRRWNDEVLHGLADATGVAMLVGTTAHEHTPTRMNKYNSAILFEPHAASVHAYHKIHLVPFGEYIPFFQSMPWLRALTPYGDDYIPTLTFGQDATIIPFGPYRLAVGICFEDTVPHVIRRFFAEANGPEPDVLVNMSNDGWFHESEELDMHLAVSVFRAVEHRVPLVRAVNTGISALVDGNGRIRESLGRGIEGVLSVAVPLDDRSSAFTALGDWLGLSCLAVAIGLVPMGLMKRLRQPRPSSSPDSRPTGA